MKTLQMDINLLLTVARTAKELLRNMNVDDLERP